MKTMQKTRGPPPAIRDDLVTLFLLKSKELWTTHQVIHMVEDRMVPNRLKALQDASPRAIYKAFQELHELGALEMVTTHKKRKGRPQRVYRFVSPLIDPASRVHVIISGLVDKILSRVDPTASNDEIIRMSMEVDYVQHSAWADICSIFGIEVEDEDGLIYAQHVPWSHATGGYREDQPPDPSDWKSKKSIRVADFITKKDE